MQRPLRSVLYAPASNIRALEKARNVDCDAVILDLEDSVAPDAKPKARETAVRAIAEGGFGHRLVAIRVNGLGSTWGHDDFAAVSDSAVDAIVVPKINNAREAIAAGKAARGLPVWAMIESPRGVIEVASIAAVPNVAALVAGTADLGKELKAKPGRDRSAVLFALMSMLNAARAYGLIALDGIHADIADMEGLERTSQQGAELGFDGRTIVHPSHIDAANRAYSPTTGDIEHARGLIVAHEQAVADSRGATTFNGQLVEVLHVTEARRLLDFADRISARLT